MTANPWAFGIDRASLETATVDLCERVMVQAIDPTFDREQISIVDQGAGRPIRPRPCITVLISSPIGSPRAGANERYWPAKERWFASFDGSADDTYTVTVLGIDYVVVAVGLSITELRDAMLTEMGLSAHPSWTVVAVGTDLLQIDSTVDGLQLLISSSPSDLFTTRQILNYIKRGFMPALLQVNINCWGLMDLEQPSAVQSGPSIAENMRAAFLDTDLTLPLRRCWFSPITARVLDGAPVINRQTNSSAICQVVMRATTRMDIQVASGTQITTKPEFPGV